LTENKGKKLPEDTFRILSASNSDRKNIVIPLLTIDEMEFPHVCLLSPYQIVSETSAGVYFMIYPDSQTRQNLDRKGRATLLIPESIGLLYVKGETRYLQEIHFSDGTSQCLYLITELQVTLDKSEVAPINSNLTFETSIIGKAYQRKFQEMVKQIESGS
jgi:hypothetical protein